MPDHFLVYRDGVSEGMFQQVIDFEIKKIFESFKKGIKNIKNWDPKLTYIIVQKNIRQRFFAPQQVEHGREQQVANPACGTIIDNTITSNEIYDFYVIPQFVNQGTVTPVHYVVIHDDKIMLKETLYKLTYKLCLQYYNWPGPVRVPNCLKYAQKHAELMGQHIHPQATPNIDVEFLKKLHYL